ncbi:MAG: thioredoxin family protein [Planctomycetota bacterium]|jgi:glutaredoxin
MSANKKLFEVFSAGCPICSEAAEAIRSRAGEGTEVRVLDMNDPSVAERAKALGIRSVPAVVVDGVLASCCAGRGVDLDALGLGE